MVMQQGHLGTSQALIMALEYQLQSKQRILTLRHCRAAETFLPIPQLARFTLMQAIKRSIIMIAHWRPRRVASRGLLPSMRELQIQQYRIVIGYGRLIRLLALSFLFNKMARREVG